MTHNQTLINKVSCGSLDKKEILNIMHKYGICILPKYLSSPTCDQVRHQCIKRIEIPEDKDFEDGDEVNATEHRGEDSVFPNITEGVTNLSDAAQGESAFDSGGSQQQAEDGAHEEQQICSISPDKLLDFMLKQAQGKPQAFVLLLDLRFNDLN